MLRSTHVRVERLAFHASKSRNVNAYVKLELARRAVWRALQRVAADARLANARLAGGQYAEAVRRLAEAEE